MRPAAGFLAIAASSAACASATTLALSPRHRLSGPRPTLAAASLALCGCVFRLGLLRRLGPSIRNVCRCCLRRWAKVDARTVTGFQRASTSLPPTKNGSLSMTRRASARASISARRLANIPTLIGVSLILDRLPEQLFSGLYFCIEFKAQGVELVEIGLFGFFFCEVLETSLVVVFRFFPALRLLLDDPAARLHELKIDFLGDGAIGAERHACSEWLSSPSTRHCGLSSHRTRSRRAAPSFPCARSLAAIMGGWRFRPAPPANKRKDRAHVGLPSVADHHR